ncbi:hypothetical protein FKM82_030943 [Ascaphus truei]
MPLTLLRGRGGESTPTQRIPAEVGIGGIEAPHRSSCRSTVWRRGEEEEVWCTFGVPWAYNLSCTAAAVCQIRDNKDPADFT